MVIVYLKGISTHGSQSIGLAALGTGAKAAHRAGLPSVESKPAARPSLELRGR
jgi:hypothetical protein